MFSDLIGTPFVLGKTDCWWLVREVFSRYGIIVPEYNPSREAVKRVCFNAVAVANIVDNCIQTFTKEEWRILEKPKIPCSVVMSLGVPRGFFNHIGAFIGGGRFINTRRKVGCCIERLEITFYKNCDKRYYEYVG